MMIKSHPPKLSKQLVKALNVYSRYGNNYNILSNATASIACINIQTPKLNTGNCRTIQSNITKHAIYSSRRHPFDWEKQLCPLCMAYNTSVHPTTGYFPFVFMFGRQAHMPIDLMYDSPTLSMDISTNQFASDQDGRDLSKGEEANGSYVGSPKSLL